MNPEPDVLHVSVDLYNDGNIIDVVVSGYHNPLDGITALAAAASEQSLAALEEQAQELSK